MNTPGLEQIANTQEHFDMIQRFVQKIGCTTMQGPTLRFLVNIGREDNDWQVDFTPLGTQGVQNRESIKIWHEQIEQDQVWIELAAKFGDTAGISRGVASALMTMTGIFRVVSAPRNCEKTSHPFRSGRWISSKIRSGECLRAKSKPRRPCIALSSSTCGCWRRIS